MKLSLNPFASYWLKIDIKFFKLSLYVVNYDIALKNIKKNKDLKKVSAASRKFISWDLPLHGLLLNAGIFGGEYLQSAQGHEERMLFY